ncbi:ABC transporter ATP-binding protein/permease [Clostridioides difficile]|nr:ABC transporter ATP-binding protein [Clostridioides difficile]MDN9333079.1 ABC transporter ATP-binding protein/permease [Clostridioides difficile]
MRELIRKFTMSHPKQMIEPVVWQFLEGFTMTFPAVAIYFAINLFIEYFDNPSLIFDKGYWEISLWMAGFFLLQLTISTLTFLRTFLPGARNSTENKKEFIQKIKRLPLGFFSKTRSGELVNTFTGDFLAIEQSMVGMFTGLFGVVFSCLVTSFFMFWFNWKMALAFYVTIPISSIIILISMKVFGSLSVNMRFAKDETADALNEYLLGMKILRSYNQIGEGFSKLEGAYKHLRDVSIKGESIGGSLLGLALTFARAGLPIMCFVGTYLLLGGEVNLVVFLSIIIIGTKIISPLLTWIRYTAVLRSNYVSATRIDNVMQEKELSGEKTIENIEDIEFEKINFSYIKGENIINDISCTFKKNSLTAIVGPSGGGKSTILKLIARFWDVDDGTIKIGDLSLGEIDTDSWLKNISMVLQDVYLFNETIRENIIFGNENATEDDMIRASKLAGCHDFIEKLPDGYETIVGEGGSTLSGGEKQRISIARAILKDAPILLLDEPTSSLDAKNEVLVQKAISNLVKDKTVIMIAHRLKTIKNADHIIVLDSGKISEEGNHEELMIKEGLYHRLWNLQNKSKEWKISLGGKTDE